MTAEQLIQLLTQVPFLIIFVVVVYEALLHRSRAKIDAAIFFGVLALVIVSSWLADAFGEDPRWLSTASAIALLSLPYLLLRLVDDLAGTPVWLRRAAEAGLAASALALIWFGAETAPGPAAGAILLYFVALTVYVALRFFHEAGRRTGPSRRRMQYAAAGSALLGAVIGAAILGELFPELEAIWLVISRVAALCAALAYFIAFAPPRILRRAWQEPHLRGFLDRATELPRYGSVDAMITEIEETVTRALGVDGAIVLLWDAEAGRLTAGGHQVVPDEHTLPITTEVYHSQQSTFVPDVPAVTPQYAEMLGEHQIGSLMAAPITAGDERFGVLSTYASRAPIFSRQDLRLVELFAHQVAFVLHNRALIDEQGEIRAREESVRLKEDFLSAAAHDLKTPLTTLVGQAQLMQRRARRNPEAPTDLEGIERLVSEAGRMRALINDLLDASRADAGGIISERVPVDLSAVAAAAVQSFDTTYHPIRLEIEPEVCVLGDPARLHQLIDNLVGNAIKYSPHGGEVRVGVRREGTDAYLEVSDKGIGIGPDDLPHIFERFWRSSHIDDRQFSGMGLGLYICRRIVEGHDGAITVESSRGAGSTFRARLPLTRTVGRTD